MANGRSRAWFPVVALLGATVVPYLLAEGIYSLVKGTQAETSLAYSFLANRLAAAPPAEPDPDNPASLMITSEDQIEPLLGAMVASGVGLGNSPFSELKTEEASVNSEQGECLEQKPNLRKKVGFLRGNLYNPFDQMTFFVDADRELPPELDAFFARYAFRIVRHSTNEFGERLTVPASGASRVVLVAGDSVANGLVLDDSETLSSVLQASDPTRRYINLGIARAAASDTACAMERAAGRNRGNIDEVIYVLCENDFEQGGKGSSPEELTAFLADFAAREKVARITLVSVPYIYNTVPEISRLRGHSRYGWPTFFEERTRTLELAHTRGFATLDFTDLTNAERELGQTQFAPLGLYVDHAHWSPLGVRKVVAALKALWSEPSSGNAHAAATPPGVADVAALATGTR